MRILVVDRDARGSEVVVQRIRGRGLEADSAQSAAEAILRMANFKYDFVLLEVVMPRDAAAEVLSAMNRMMTAPQCIIMSGVAALWRRANPAVAVAGVLQKPFSIEELMAVINSRMPLAPRRTSRGPIVVKIATPRDHA